MRPSLLCLTVIALATSIFAVTEASAAVMGFTVRCPSVADVGARINTKVLIRNNAQVPVVVQRGARLLHTGGINIIGPTPFALSSTFSAGETKNLVIPLTIPHAAAGKYLQVGYGFFGKVGTDVRRQLLSDGGGCMIEVRK